MEKYFHILESKAIAEFLSTKYWMPSKRHINQSQLQTGCSTCNNTCIQHLEQNIKVILGLEGKYHMTDSNPNTKLVSKVNSQTTLLLYMTPNTTARTNSILKSSKMS